MKSLRSIALASCFLAQGAFAFDGVVPTTSDITISAANISSYANRVISGEVPPAGVLTVALDGAPSTFPSATSFWVKKGGAVVTSGAVRVLFPTGHGVDCWQWVPLQSHGETVQIGIDPATNQFLVLSQGIGTETVFHRTFVPMTGVQNYTPHWRIRGHLLRVNTYTNLDAFIDLPAIDHAMGNYCTQNYTGTFQFRISKVNGDAGGGAVRVRAPTGRLINNLAEIIVPDFSECEIDYDSAQWFAYCRKNP